jgi:hypothetical protein
MSDEPKKQARPWIVWALILLVLLGYPLSYGPAYRLHFYSRDPKAHVRIVGTVYAPIGWLCTRSKPARAVTIWYLGLWIPRR